MPDETVTLKKLQEITASMLRIYPPLKDKIEGFETLIAQNFRDKDVTALKDSIINALETMRAAEARELHELSNLQALQNPDTLRKFRNILGLIQALILKLKLLENGIKEYEHKPSKELGSAINRLHRELKDLLENEEKELERFQ